MDGKVNIPTCLPFRSVIHFTYVAEKINIPFKNSSRESKEKEILCTLNYVDFYVLEKKITALSK
jgi:hypothetical protein